MVNPEQAKAFLTGVGEVHPSLEAFFGSIYYAAMRPSEVRHLSVTDLHMPPPSKTDALGTLHLMGSTQTTGAAWTDTGSSMEDRSLNHRASRATRDVPAPPQLVELLARHMDAYPPGVGARLFVTRTGRAGTPIPPPFASPWSMGIAYRLWDLSRGKAFTDAEYASTLANRPYNLRHAAVSLWLMSTPVEF